MNINLILVEHKIIMKIEKLEALYENYRKYTIILHLRDEKDNLFVRKFYSIFIKNNGKHYLYYNISTNKIEILSNKKQTYPTFVIESVINVNNENLELIQENILNENIELKDIEDFDAAITNKKIESQEDQKVNTDSNDIINKSKKKKKR